jgi:dihydrofolate reductase
MRKLILIVHTSLDGFVAGLNGELDYFNACEENLEFICSLTKQADTALFGRVSYQLLNSNWLTVKDRQDATWNQVAYSCWYNVAKKIVVSENLLEEDAQNATIIRRNLFEEIQKLKEATGNQVLVFGSPTLSRSLMRLHLIDECWIFINPVLFGEGIRLFGDIIIKTKLVLLNTKLFANGEIGLHYAVARP